MARLIIGIAVIVGVVGVTAGVALWGGPTSASDQETPPTIGATEAAAAPAGPSETQKPPAFKPVQQPDEEEDGDQSHARQFVGISIGPLSDEERVEKGVTGGAVVRHVLPGSPAADKLHSGDMVTSIGDLTISGPDDVVEVVRGSEIGAILNFNVVRGGETARVDVEVGERPDEAFALKGGLPDRLHELVAHLHELASKFVRLDFVMETDEGFETVSVVTGLVTDLDVPNRTFNLVPRDGSDAVSVQVSDTTTVGLLREGDIGGLNTTDKTLVVKIGDDVILVVQPFPPMENLEAAFEKLHDKLGMLGLGGILGQDLSGLLGPHDLPEGMLDRLPALPPSLFGGDVEDQGDLRELQKSLMEMFSSMQSGAQDGEKLDLGELFKDLPFDLEKMFEQMAPSVKESMEAPEAGR